MDNSGPLYSFFSSFQQLTVNGFFHFLKKTVNTCVYYKILPMSGFGLLVLEMTTLPTEPQPLPIH